MQYAGSHLHTPLFVVLGDEGGAAVAETLDAILHHAHEAEHIESLIKLIRPGLKEFEFNQGRENLLHAAVEANVRWSMQQLLMFSEAIAR
ncbi:carbonic anhydrase [Nitrosomonas sp.]|uniref:carbonic anhydrase n=1 Tax=Nitrosomonas sp. TaxID=42353 RepID=UPI00260BD61F|nr:carbonic anhydrase [Nitrosomonas sp.]MCW5601390.1 hypothetical protein [Nitrosomonas sp.]